LSIPGTLSGISEVRLTAEGAVPITPLEAEAARPPHTPPPGKSTPLACREAEAMGEGGGGEESDWLALYKPEVRPDSPVDALPADQQHVLLPLLTPSNSKLCAALVDAFLPLSRPISSASRPIACG